MPILAQGQVLPAGHACAKFRETRPTGSSSIMHTKTQKNHVTLNLDL